MMSATFTVDHVTKTHHKRALQDAADAAALGAVRELRIMSAVPNAQVEQELERVARELATANLGYDIDLDGLTVELVNDSTVSVLLESSPNTILFGSGSGPQRAKAVAEFLGGADVCAVILNERDSYSLDLNNDSSITAPGCAIYSNSDHEKGIDLSDNAFIDAAHICSAGGARGMSSAYRPRPSTDCIRLKDPLGHKLSAVETVAGAACIDSEPTKLDGVGATTLAPGRYCHDLSISGDHEVKFAPGIYLFDDSKLTLAGKSVVTGDDIALVFHDKGARMVIDGESEVRLSGRLTGELAGFLILSEPRKDKKIREFPIFSPNVKELVGTVYLPNDYLNILTDQPVASESAFTVVVVRRLKLHGSATLVLNRNYAATSVPKYDGLMEHGSGHRLIE